MSQISENMFILCATFLLTCLTGYGHAAMCEPVRIPMCKTMAWNMTRMPNLLHHSTQENAILAIEQTEVLVKTGCSKDLLFFLCAMFSPICTVEFQQEGQQDGAIKPCKAVCERARAGCEHHVIKAGRKWPDNLSCDHLPSYDKGVCISPEAIVSTLPEVKPQGKGDGGGSPGSKGKKGNCKCKKSQKPKRKTYTSKGYHYAFHGSVLFQNDDFDGNIVTTVKVLSAIHQPSTHLVEGNTVDLWSRGPCVCPQLKKSKSKTYLIVGYEDKINKRLLFNEDSIAVKWKESWPSLIKKWENRMKRSSTSKKKLPKDAADTSKTKTSSKKGSSGKKKKKRGKKRRKGGKNRNRQKTTPAPTLAP